MRKILTFALALFSLNIYAADSITPKLRFEPSQGRVGDVIHVIAEFYLDICNKTDYSRFYNIGAELIIQDPINKSISQEYKVLVSAKSCVQETKTLQLKTIFARSGDYSASARASLKDKYFSDYNVISITE